MSNSAMALQAEDVGNIVGMEHVNLTVPDQSTATAFYLTALGGTRDPYLMVGVDNMWVNLGNQQFHLPTNQAPAPAGARRAGDAEPEPVEGAALGGGGEACGDGVCVEDKHCCVDITGPWGNSFRCYDGRSDKFGEMSLGIPYVEFGVPSGTAEGIAAFYRQILGAPG